MARHDRRDSVLVNELRMPVAAQEHAEIIEPGHHALQFDAVDQEDGQRNFALADVIEECVLQILCAVGCHGRCFRFCTAGPCPAGLFLCFLKQGGPTSGTYSEHCYFNEKDRFARLSPTFRAARRSIRRNRANLLDGTAPRDASASWRRRNDSAVVAPAAEK